MFTIEVEETNRELLVYKKDFLKFKLNNIVQLNTLKEFLKLEIEECLFDKTKDDFEELNAFLDKELFDIITSSYPTKFEKIVFLQKEYKLLFSSFYTFPQLAMEDSTMKLIQVLEDEVAFEEDHYKYKFLNDQFVDAINMKLEDGYIDEFLENFRFNFFSENKSAAIMEFELMVLLEKIDKFLLFEKYQNVVNKDITDLSMSEEEYIKIEERDNDDYPDAPFATETLRDGSIVFYNDYNSWYTWQFISKLITDAQRLYFSLTNSEFVFQNDHLNKLETNLTPINQNIQKEEITVSHLYLYLYLAMRSSGLDYYTNKNKKVFRESIESLLDGNSINNKEIANVYHIVMSKFKIKRRTRHTDRLFNSQFNAGFDQAKFEKLLFIITDIDKELPPEHSILDEIQKARDEGVNKYFPR